VGNRTLIAFQAEEAGSTAVEYALIAVLVVLSALLGLTAMSGSMNELFKESDGSITTTINEAGG